jgi:hypothetical protein
MERPRISGKRTLSNDGETIVFKPSSPLEYSTQYDVMIEDAAGRYLAKWCFTTTSGNSVTTPSGKLTVIAEREITNAKAVIGKSNDGNLYDRTVDGDLNTRWSNYGKDSWIKYDLGSDRDLCAIDIGWFKGDKRIYDFKILHSRNDSNENGYEDVQPSSFRSSGKTLSPERYTFAKIRARYVKIVVNGNNQNNWASITEIAFYECANSSSS